jgi:hypothetical protein
LIARDVVDGAAEVSPALSSSDPQYSLTEKDDNY